MPTTSRETDVVAVAVLRSPARGLAALTCLVLVALLAACGGSGGGSTPTPADLVGEWKQTNSNSDDAWQAATISKDAIEIY